MDFQVLGKPVSVETIAVGSSIREIARLRKMYGRARWTKKKGIARVRLPGGSICLAELHWYEAHGMGKKETKLKRILR